MYLDVFIYILFLKIFFIFRFPEIQMITEDKKRYCKFADPNLMLNLIQMDYKDWDFYCLNYLISDSELRGSLNNLFSKKKNDTNKNAGFFISEVDTTKPLFSREQKFKFTNNETKLSIFFTDENRENYINTLLPYKVTVIRKKIKNKNGFVFNFNFKEMVKLIKIYLKWNLIKFFKKYINIDYKKKSINIDKVYLSIIDDSFLNYIVDYEEVIDTEKQFIDLEIL